MSASLTRQIGRFLDAYRLAKPGTHMLLAVSGGADSTAMLLACHELAPSRALRLTVAHLNHRIRGKAADADARFVQDLCERLGVRCAIGRADVPGLARRKRISIEMAAREARYRFLTRTAHQIGAAAIATAHTKDDQAETLLLKLARGAGPEGLSGIAPFTDRPDRPALIRPLLSVSRNEVEAFLRKRGQTWREDVSNQDRSHLRNRVRYGLLPMLESELNPAIRETLARTAEIMREENAWMDAEARRLCPEAELDVDRLTDLPAALRRRVLRIWLGAHGVPTDCIDFSAVNRIERVVAQARGTRSIELPGGSIIRRRYRMLNVERRTKPAPFRLALKVPGETLLPDLGLRVRAEIVPGIVRVKSRCGDLPAGCSLSRKAIGRRKLYVRSWRPGDRMNPLGMTGSRKLQDIFTDAKVPADRRPTLPVFECGGEIVWIPGYRIARGWAVGAAAPAVQVRVVRR